MAKPAARRPAAGPRSRRAAAPGAPQARTSAAAADDDIRERALAATRRLLVDRRFDQISVADILDGAEISRGSFYFYFDGKYDVLAELVRRAVSRGHEAAGPWLSHEGPDERLATVVAGISEGAKLWQREAPVLRAIVENWRSDSRLSELWLGQMEGFTAVTAERIEADRDGKEPVRARPDARALASALTWLGERLYYLAAIGVAPFDDQRALVDVLTYIWMATLYPDEMPHGRDHRATNR